MWFLATGVLAKHAPETVGWDPDPSRLFGCFTAVWLLNPVRFQLPSASVDLGLWDF